MCVKPSPLALLPYLALLSHPHHPSSHTVTTSTSSSSTSAIIIMIITTSHTPSSTVLLCQEAILLSTCILGDVFGTVFSSRNQSNLITATRILFLFIDNMTHATLAVMVWWIAVTNENQRYVYIHQELQSKVMPLISLTHTHTLGHPTL